MRLALLLGPLSMAACARPELDMDAGTADGVAPESTFQASPIRVDVTPSGELAADGFLAQTFAVVADSAVTMDLAFRRPVQLSGIVSGYELAPMAVADLPGQTIALAGALVSIRQENTTQSANDVSADDGSYALTVVPDSDYHMLFTPTDPLVPFRTTPLVVSEDSVTDVDLGYGSALWGHIVDEDGLGRSDVGVHAVDALGNSGASAHTDEAGFYVLRVDPGTYTVVAEGHEDGRDPVLTSPVVDVPTAGIAVDFSYGPLDRASITGRVVDDRGQGLPFHTVRFTALALDGYGDDAQWDGDAITNSDGNIDSRLPPGLYRVDILAEADEALSSADLQIEVDDDVEDIGTVALDPTVDISGRVVDPQGIAVAAALISVEEVGFLGRKWQVSADDAGRFTVRAPEGSVSVTLTPPASRTDLAISRTQADASSDSNAILSFQAGAEIHGVLRHPDASGELVPSAECIVEALDSAGRRLGVALTDADGRYGMQIAP